MAVEIKYKIGDKAATRDGYGDALLDLGLHHTDIVVLDADLAKSTKSILFGRKFPDRFKYVGISEADMVSMGAGLARCGKVPFVSTFASFFNRAIDQIRVSVAYSRTNVKMVGSHGGIITGEDGPTGQEISDIAIMKSIPNLNVLVPADYYETVACTRAMYENEGPVYMRTVREKTGILFDKIPEFEFGKAQVLRDGADAAIIAIGPLVAESMKAAKMLHEKGVSVSVLDCASIKPIDFKAIEKEARKNWVFSAEDGVVHGLGGAVAEIIAQKNFGCRLAMIGMGNSFAESGKSAELYKKYGFDSESICRKVSDCIKGGKK